MSDLPHGLTEPLRYLQPFPWPALVAAGLALALALAVALALRRRPRRAPAPPAAAPVAPAAAVAGGALAELRGLRRRHLEAATYRRGCHDLSAFLRRHLEATRRRPFSSWTAREVRRAEGDTAFSRLLALVSELQFSRRPPARSDFEGICDLAGELLVPEARG